MPISPSEYVKRLRSMRGDLAKVALSAMKQTLQRTGVAMARKETLRREAVATSEYLNAWVAETRGSDSVALTNLSPHAGFVRFGRKPGKMPPVSAIMAWIEVKFAKGGKEAQSMAWAIAKKIADRGVRGRDILRGIRSDLNERVKINVLRAVNKRLTEKR